MYASLNGHINVVRKLMELGANVDYTEPIEGNTALHLAAQCGHTRTVELLLKSKDADPMKVNFKGKTPYQLAKDFGHGNNKVMKRLFKEAGCGYLFVDDHDDYYVHNNHENGVDFNIINNQHHYYSPTNNNNGGDVFRRFGPLISEQHDDDEAIELDVDDVCNLTSGDDENNNKKKKNMNNYYRSFRSYNNDNSFSKKVNSSALSNHKSNSSNPTISYLINNSSPLASISCNNNNRRPQLLSSSSAINSNNNQMMAISETNCNGKGGRSNESSMLPSQELLQRFNQIGIYHPLPSGKGFAFLTPHGTPQEMCTFARIALQLQNPLLQTSSTSSDGNNNNNKPQEIIVMTKLLRNKLQEIYNDFENDFLFKSQLKFESKRKFNTSEIASKSEPVEAIGVLHSRNNDADCSETNNNNNSKGCSSSSLPSDHAYYLKWKQVNMALIKKMIDACNC